MCPDSLARDALAALFQHPGDRVLGEPVDLQVGVQLAQFVGDRHVPLGVAEADRGGDVQHALAARLAAHPARACARGGGEVAQQQVDLDRVAHVRAMARALEQHEIAAGRLGERDPAAGSGDRVFRTLDHQHRAADPAAQLARGLLVQAVTDLRGDERLGGGLQAPADAVFDRLGRVRLGEHQGEEKLQEAVVIAQPGAEVVFRPALVGGQHLVPRVPRAVLQRRGERHGRADEDGPAHPVRVLGCHDEAALRADRERDDHRTLGRGGVHHRQGIGGELGFPVSRRRAV
jgi:hypothetical protein